MISLDIRSLKEGFQILEFSPTTEDLRVENPDGAEGKGSAQPTFREAYVEVQVTVDGEQFVVRVFARAVAELICDRTLEPFDRAIRGKFTVCFMPESMMDKDAENDAVLPLPKDSNEIDLTDIVRDTLMLAVPVRKIAPGAEELDLPTTFGEASEEDIDPRWKGLEQLRSTSEESPD